MLRAYFDTQLLIAESRGKIAHDFRVFFMGHKGSMEAKYTTNKGILPQTLIDEMRDAFSRSEGFLDLEKGEIPAPEKVSEKNMGKLTPAELEQLQKLLQKIRGSEAE